MWIFPVYRVTAAIYIVAWNIVGFASAPNALDQGQRPIICYVTIWSFLLLAVYLTFAAVVCVVKVVRSQRSMCATSQQTMTDVTVKYPAAEDASSDSGDTTAVTSDPTLSSIASVMTTQSIQPATGRHHLPWYTRLCWVLFNMAAGSAPVVTVIYFAVLFPMIRSSYPDYSSNVFDIHVHGLNSIIILCEFCLGAIPVRLFHTLYPALYGLAYVLFSIIYWSIDKEHNVLYPYVLDWNHPGITMAVVCVLIFLVLPLLQLAWFGLYSLRLYIFKRIYGYEYIIL